MLTTRAALTDTDKRAMLASPIAYPFTKADCAAAEARIESFRKVHAMQCLRDFKLRHNGRVPYVGDMIW